MPHNPPQRTRVNTSNEQENQYKQITQDTQTDQQCRKYPGKTEINLRNPNFTKTLISQISEKLRNPNFINQS